MDLSIREHLHSFWTLAYTEGKNNQLGDGAKINLIKNLIINRARIKSIG